MATKFVSGGTYNSQDQHGGLYPQTFYASNMPLDNRLFKEYLEKSGKEDCVISSFATGEYASVGGTTQSDLVADGIVEPTCDPLLPLGQNHYSSSHYAGPMCESQEVPGLASQLSDQQKSRCMNNSNNMVNKIQNLSNTNSSQSNMFIILAAIILMIFLLRKY